MCVCGSKVREEISDNPQHCFFEQLSERLHVKNTENNMNGVDI